MIGSPEDTDFLEKNNGKGIIFPGGQTCQFNGKDVACFCRWSPNGSITSEILRDILATLDNIALYYRSTGIIPCVLLDGYGSRFGLSFLEYVSEDPHQWCVVIGVPYGTALWQVGDLLEQNTAAPT